MNSSIKYINLSPTKIFFWVLISFRHQNLSNGPGMSLKLVPETDYERISQPIEIFFFKYVRGIICSHHHFLKKETPKHQTRKEIIISE